MVKDSLSGTTTEQVSVLILLFKETHIPALSPKSA